MKIWTGTALGCLLVIWAPGQLPLALRAAGQSQAVAVVAVGEKVTYSIKQLGITSGTATLVYQGQAPGEAADVHLIVFTADGMNFYDQEKIYFHHQSFLPMRVERDINIFGKKEKIIEYYEPDQERIRIVKTIGKATEEQIIKKAGPIDNIYCFIYRYRQNGQFALNEALNLRLPTQDVAMSIVDQPKLKVAGELYDAFYLQSHPEKYHIWFDGSEKKIPLRIDGAIGFGKTAMIMSKYENPS